MTMQVTSIIFFVNLFCLSQEPLVMRFPDLVEECALWQHLECALVAIPSVIVLLWVVMSALEMYTSSLLNSKKQESATIQKSSPEINGKCGYQSPMPLFPSRHDLAHNIKQVQAKKMEEATEKFLLKIRQQVRLLSTKRKVTKRHKKTIPEPVHISLEQCAPKENQKQHSENLSENLSENKKRKVSFSNAVTVCYIPQEPEDISFLSSKIKSTFRFIFQKLLCCFLCCRACQQQEPPRSRIAVIPLYNGK